MELLQVRLQLIRSRHQSIVDVYADHEQETLKKGLVKYTGIFYNIGMLLIAFALLIALLSKPLNKLMHGVK